MQSCCCKIEFSDICQKFIKALEMGESSCKRSDIETLVSAPFHKENKIFLLKRRITVCDTILYWTKQTYISEMESYNKLITDFKEAIDNDSLMNAILNLFNTNFCIYYYVNFIERIKKGYKESLQALCENEQGIIADNIVNVYIEKDMRFLENLLKKYDLEQRERLDYVVLSENLLCIVAVFAVSVLIYSAVSAVSTCYAEPGQEGMFDCLTSVASDQIGNATESVCNWYAGMVGGGE